MRYVKRNSVTHWNRRKIHSRTLLSKFKRNSITSSSTTHTVLRMMSRRNTQKLLPLEIPSSKRVRKLNRSIPARLFSEMRFRFGMNLRMLQKNSILITDCGIFSSISRTISMNGLSNSMINHYFFS